MSRDFFIMSPASVPAPSTPTGLRVIRMYNRSLRLTWNESTEKSLSGYRIYHSTDDSTYTLLEDLKAIQFIHRKLTAATHYYKILAVMSGMESDLSAAVSVVLASPVMPTGLRVSRMKGQSLRVSWDQSEPSAKGEGFEGYKLYHSTDNVTYNVFLTVKGEFSLQLNLSPATHYYKVSHLANGAESALCTAVSVVIGDPLPYSKTDVIAAAGSPVTLDIETVLSRKATGGTVICLGPGVLEMELSYDGGTTWTDVLELRPEDYLDLSDERGHLEFSHIRLDADVSGTGYTVSVV